MIALNEGKEVIVTGDMNINSLKWMRDDLDPNDAVQKVKPLINTLFEKIVPYGVSQQVTSATHKESCLDHVYTNKPEMLSECRAIYNGGSDHKMIQTVRYSKSVQRQERYIRKRCYKHFDEESFRAEIGLVQWIDVYLCDNADAAVQIFTKKITDVLDRHAPVKSVQVRAKYAPWLSNLTKMMIQQRNLAQQAAVLNPSLERNREYRNIRNRVTNMIRQDKKIWEQNRFNHLTNESSTLWKNLKGLMNWKQSGPPTQLFYEGKFINSPKELAESMNRFFTQKVKLLQEKIPPASKDPLESLRDLMAKRSCKLDFKAVYPEEVAKIVKSLKNTKSTGTDNIDVGIVKLILDDILPSLTHIVNISLLNSEFPSAWKWAKVIPLLKKGDPLNPQNYRPVALLPVVSKILEKVVYQQVVKYMESNKLFQASHHGSRARHNTTSALIVYAML